MPFTTALVVGGLGAATGLMQAKAQAKQNKMNADISAAQTQYSPWTGLGASTPQLSAPNAAGNALSGAIGGGLAGYMQGQANMKSPVQSMSQSPSSGGGYSSYGSPEDANVAATSAWMSQPTSNKKTFYSQDPEMLKRMQGQV